MEKKWNKLIDHTLLKANASKNDITKLCDEQCNMTLHLFV